MQDLKDITLENAGLEFRMVESERITEISESVAVEAGVSYREAFSGPKSIGRSTEENIKDFNGLMNNFIHAAIDGEADVFKRREITAAEIGFTATMCMTTRIFVANRARGGGRKTQETYETAIMGAEFTHLVASVFINTNVTEEQAKSFWDGLNKIFTETILDNQKPDPIYLEELKRGVIAEVAVANSLMVSGYEVSEPSRDDDLRNQIDLIAISTTGQKVYIQCKGRAGLTESVVTPYDPKIDYEWSNQKTDLYKLVSKAKFDKADLAVLVEVGFDSPELNKYTGNTTKEGTNQIVWDLNNALRAVSNGRSRQ